LLTIGALATLSAPAYARSDEQLWTNANVTVKLADHWRLSEEMTGRWSDNGHGLYEVESNTLLGYKLNKVVTILGGYTHNPQYSGGRFTIMEHRVR
jgi:hypothetical protein